jgi:hypothetical protein
VHLAFDIFQGLGIAAAVGIRPFLPALVTGALATGDIQIDFNGTSYAFLQGTPFLLAMVVATCAFAVAGWRWRSGFDRRPVMVAMLIPAIGLGAILFAGALAQNERTTWPGLIAGVLCALLGAAATVPLLRRARARLDAEAAGATGLFAEGAALVVAALSVLAPPVGVLVVLALGWLLISGVRRGPQKYAGLRVLR